MMIPDESVDPFPLTREAWHEFVTQRRRVERDLLERVKELNCLYGITRLAQRVEHDLPTLLGGIADLIPASWQYPDITCAAIVLDGVRYASANYQESPWQQRSAIAIRGELCGEVIVGYLEERPECGEGPFLLEERSLINAVADLVGRIVAQRWADEQMRFLSQELIKAQEHERQRIARELHDHVAQDLALAKADLERLSCFAPQIAACRGQIDAVVQRLSSTIHAIRDLAYGLLPPGLTELGLVETVAAHCEDFSLRYGIAVEVFADGLDGIDLGFEVQINVYRIIQEALANVRRHAKASHVCIRMLGAYPHLIVHIQDNGSGMDWDGCQRRPRTRSMGLWSMRERVRLLGGTISLKSNPGQGLTIRLEIPLERQEGV